MCFQMIIYITRHGESIFNVKRLLGGNSGLSPKGLSYSGKLFEYFKENNLLTNLNLLTSNMLRTKMTAQHFPKITNSFDFINEIDAGIFDSKSAEYIKNNNINEYQLRKNDKFNYIYPQGESYRMLQKRVLKILDHLEDDKINLVVCHNAVLRVIYAHFNKISNDEMPHLEIPLHTLFYLKVEEGQVVESNMIPLI